MKIIEMKEIDGLNKLPCSVCGNYFSELKFRNGVLFCNNCRTNDRVQSFIDNHVKPTASELKIVMKDFSDILLEDVDRKLHDFGDGLKAELISEIKRLLGL